MLLFFQVIVCIALVIATGTQLSQSADILAEKTGLGRTWVGTILLAGVTSLPELATGTSAIVMFNSPDLAVGGILGSCLFNLLILALLDVYMAYATLHYQQALCNHRDSSRPDDTSCSRHLFCIISVRLDIITT
jgi:Ca2+/Na+ antiporter